MIDDLRSEHVQVLASMPLDHRHAARMLLDLDPDTRLAAICDPETEQPIGSLTADLLLADLRTGAATPNQVIDILSHHTPKETPMPAPATDEFHITADEETVIGRYRAAVGVIPDTLDGLTLPDDTAHTVDELRMFADLLRTWWAAIDGLDADLGGDGIGESHRSRGAALICNLELIAWFAVRDDLYRAVARHAGVDVPHLVNADGLVTTSNRVAGDVGFRPVNP